ncbi:MAG: hypothetical protein AB1551_04365 [Actinomycetota bacterium]
MTDWTAYLVSQEPSGGYVIPDFAGADPIGNRGPEPADLSSEEGRRWLRLEAAARLMQGQGEGAVELMCAQHPTRLVCRVSILPDPCGASMLSYLDTSTRLLPGHRPTRARDWFCFLLDVDDELTELPTACPAGHEIYTAAAPILDAIGGFRATRKVRRLAV